MKKKLKIDQHLPGLVEFLHDSRYYAYQEQTAR